MFRLLLTFTTALLAGLTMLLGSASAHALLIRSQPNQGAVVPREPPVIHLWFSENLNSSLSKAIVWNRQRQEVDLKNDTVSHSRELTISLRPHLADGTYLVLWTSVSSQDGHVLKGAYLFSIGHRGPPPAPSLTGSGNQRFPPDLGETTSLIARAIELAGSALWLGLALFLTLTIPTSSAAPASVSLAASAFRRALRLMPVTLAVLFLARMAGLIIQANTLAGDWGSTFRASTFHGLLLQTEYGHLWMGMQALVVIGLLVSVLALRRNPVTHEISQATPISAPPREQTVFSFVLPLPRLYSQPQSPAAALLALALVEAFLLAASGHAASVNLAHTGTGIFTLPVALDWLHLLATGIWVGGIFAVALVLIPAFKSSAAFSLSPFLDTLDRFSPFAYASVIVLVLTGGFNGKVHVPSWTAFFDAVYGRALIVKILLVGLMIIISAFTVGIVRPRLRRMLRQNPQGGSDRGPIAYLQAVLVRWLRIGAVLGAVVFLATAVLNAYPVPVTFGAPSGPFAISGRSGSLEATLKLDPGKAGPNTFIVHLRQHGKLIRLAEVRIIETMLDMNMGTQYLILNEKGRGTFKGSGQVAMGGHWQFELLVRLHSSLKLRHILLKTVVGG